MKRSLLLAVVIGTILIFAGVASAELTPRTFVLINAEALSGNTFVDSREQDIENRSNDLGGNFAISLDATSATGVADVKVEVIYFNPSSQTWETVYYRYEASTDTLTTYNGLVIDSTVTRFARQGAFYFYPVRIPVVTKFIVRVTGVGSNPADTIITAHLIRV